ncbi:hypothetical protein Bca4012_097527 [Brassica carinata]
MASSDEKVIEGSFSGFDGHFFEVAACRRWSLTDRTESPQGGEPPIITFKKGVRTTRLFCRWTLRSLGDSSSIGSCPSPFLAFVISSFRRKSERLGRLSLILRSSDFELS